MSSFIKRSTTEFLNESRRTPGQTWFDWLHGYVYARWPYLYIGVAVGEHPLARRLTPLVGRGLGWYERLRKLKPQTSTHTAISSDLDMKVGFADTYHGKVVPLSAASQLVMVKEPIRIENLEHIIPYRKARDIVLQQPDHLVALDCPCRSSRENPCLPLDVCLIVGEPFASFVLEHHPGRSRQINQQEAVKILQEEDARGHVHHAFFKDAMLGRFYAICNCCDCCCGAMQAHRHGTPMLASSGYVAHVDEALCIGCQTCREFCQFHALKLNGNTMAVQEDACMGCGICVSKCDQEALSLQREPAKGEPLEIFELMSAAAG